MPPSLDKSETLLLMIAYIEKKSHRLLAATLRTSNFREAIL